MQNDSQDRLDVSLISNSATARLMTFGLEERISNIHCLWPALRETACRCYLGRKQYSALFTAVETLSHFHRHRQTLWTTRVHGRMRLFETGALSISGYVVYNHASRSSKQQLSEYKYMTCGTCIGPSPVHWAFCTRLWSRRCVRSLSPSV